LQKKNGRVCKKPPALPRRPGGGGKIYGQNSAEQFKLSSQYQHHTIWPPLGERRKLFWVGSSHALRLSQAALRNKDIKNRFQNDTYVRPGATFTQLHIPWNKLKLLNAQDVVIFQLFGNDLCEKYIRIDRIPKKTIHLTKFSPTDESVLQNKFLALKTLLDGLSYKIIIIDIPFRHVKCCPKHRYSGLRKHETQANKLLKEVLTSYLVVDHRKLLGVSFNRVKRMNEYRELLSDSVHFYDKYYDAMVANIVKRFIDAGSPPVYLMPTTSTGYLA
jgi:hypothetical protein